MMGEIKNMSATILSVAENATLTEEQKLDVVSGILTKLLKLGIETKVEQYKFRNLLEHISKECSNKGTSSARNITGNEGLFGIFLPDNSFTIARFETSDYIDGIYSRYNSWLTDIATEAIIEYYSNKSIFDKHSPLRKSQQGVTILNDGSKAYFITLKNLTSQIENPTCDIDKFTKEIILVVNAYLNEHPFFVDHTVFKSH